MMRTASFGAQPWLASTRITTFSPTAWRMAWIRSTSPFPSFPTFTFRMRNPCSTPRRASSTICDTSLTLMVRSVSIESLPPPSTLYRGLPRFLAYRSYTAISTAALAEVFFRMAFCILRMMPSMSSISIPRMAGAMNSRMAVSMEPHVSPVITAVAGASPYPAWPSSAVIRTTISRISVTVRRAVRKGVTSGIRISPSSIF